MIKSWEQITIQKWQEINEVQSESEVVRIIETVSILTDRDPEELRQMKINDFRELQSEFSWASNPPSADLNIKFEIDGIKYGMIPQLDFISAGEWLDCESWKSDSVKNMHLYASLLFRPITNETENSYTIEPHKTEGFIERSKLFLERLSITKVYGAVLFFSAFGIEFMKIIQDYLPQVTEVTNQMMMMQTQTPMKMQNENHSQDSGDTMI